MIATKLSSYTGESRLTEYISALRKVFLEMKEHGMEMTDETKKVKFIVGLENTAYEQFIGDAIVDDVEVDFNALVNAAISFRARRLLTNAAFDSMQAKTKVSH
jgi:hypothetical protein